MGCDCKFNNTGQTHEYDCPLHPDRSAVKMVKVDYIENLQAENKAQAERIKELESDKVRLRDVIGTIRRNIKAGAVTTQWIKNFIEQALKEII